MKNIILTAILVMFSFFKVNAQEVTTVEKVNTSVFQSQISKKKVQLIDVRTPEEYKAGTILNAINIDFLAESFMEKIKELDPQRPVYIFCQSGKRSAAAAKKMQEVGFDIIELEGGYKAWKIENN